MFNIFYKKSAGFTLIELLVTIAIVAMFLAISIPSFSTFRARNDLNKSAELVQSAIYETRNYALSPRSDKPANMRYYTFWFANNSNSYKIYQSPDTTSTLSDANLIGTYYLPSNCQFSLNQPSGGNVIYFSIENSGKIEKPSSNIVIKITNSKITQIKTLTINCVTGQVTIQ